MENSRPKIGVALSGASGRAIAHIGVLEVLRENNIPVDIIVGCSSGSLIAASFAVGSMEILKAVMFQLTFPKMLRLWSTKNAKGAVFHLNGDKMGETLNSITHGLTFEEINYPKLAFSATDINSG